MTTRRGIISGATSLGALAVTTPLRAQTPAPKAPAPMPAAQPQEIAPAKAPWHITIAPRSEPGERMAVSGVVSDGVRPIKGASVYVYHTDRQGLYVLGGGDNWVVPRLYGFMRTDARGRYAYETIRPAPYPVRAGVPAERGIPAHVHYVVTAPGFKDRAFEIQFDDDRLVRPQARLQAGKGDWLDIVVLKWDAAGTWRTTEDIVLVRR